MPDTTRTASPTYDGDFYAWAPHQAALLREVRQWQPNVPLDIEHLIEEVEDLAHNRRDAVRSQTERVLEDFLKLEFSPAADPRRLWEDSVDDVRRQLDLLLTASLEAELRQQLDDAFLRARRYAVRALKRYGEDAAAKRLPLSCPYTWEQLRDEDWYPEAKP
jgi:hypothetical protein